MYKTLDDAEPSGGYDGTTEKALPSLPLHSQEVYN